MNNRILTPDASGADRAALTSSVSRYFVMVQKELLELARSFKLLWVPLVFLLLGIMQPVSTYYMPVILEMAGSLPEGTVIEIPVPAAAEVLAQTLQQFGTLGVLVIALVCMGTVSGERLSGAASLILVKPISHLTYIASKWTALLLLAWGSLAVGYLAAWYYTGLLFGAVQAAFVLGSMLVYGLWLAFIVTMTVLFSSLLRSPAAAAFATLVCAIALSLSAGLFPKALGWTPGALSGLAYEAVVSGGAGNPAFIQAIGATIILIAAAVWGASALLRRSSAIE
jgi:ABC-2 type transport system permease protein